MLMDPNTALIVGLVAPLVTGLLVPFLAVRANWRDIAGPVGAMPNQIFAMATIQSGIYSAGCSVTAASPSAFCHSTSTIFHR